MKKKTTEIDNIKNNQKTLKNEELIGEKYDKIKKYFKGKIKY